MKNSELLEKLQQLPPEMEVNLVIVLPYGAAFIHEFEIRESPKEILDDNESPYVMIYHEEEDPGERKCRVCGCTDHDCSQCIEKTGDPCYWVEEDLCSACVPAENKSSLLLPGRDF